MHTSLLKVLVCMWLPEESSLIDFHISTDKPSWLLLRRVPLFKSTLKPIVAGPVIAKAKEAFIMQYLNPISDEPVIRIVKVNHV